MATAAAATWPAHRPVWLALVDLTVLAGVVCARVAFAIGWWDRHRPALGWKG